MTNDNLHYWNVLKDPPPDALKEIQAGRLRGKSDINPQWRLEAMTELFGPVGVGWKYAIEKLWADTMADGQVIAHAQVLVYYRVGEDWSEPIPGIGGNMLVEKEKAGLHVSDEGYKMAVTDALSVAFKALGMASTVYRGQMDTKYERQAARAPSTPASVGEKSGTTDVLAVKRRQFFAVANKLGDKDMLKAQFCEHYGVEHFDELTADQVMSAIAHMEKILKDRESA